MTHPITSLAAGARLLSNSRLTTLLTQAGTGFSNLSGTALTRWQGDPVEDGDGYFIYLRDLDTGAAWSAGAQPCPADGAHYSAGGADGAAWLACRHGDIDTRMEVAIGETDLEWRTLTVRNEGTRERRIELTSYLEVVLNARGAEASHPAFSKLFVQTEWHAASGALLARRRPRGAGEAGVWMVHAALGGDDAQHETDRKRFIGRARSPGAPAALAGSAPLSGTVGNVLDPAFSLRRTLTLAPGASASVSFMLGAAPDRAGALALLDNAAGPAAATQAASVRRTALLDQLGISPTDAARYEELATAILYRESALRAPEAVQLRAAGSAAILSEYRLPTGAALCLVHAAGPRDLTAQTLLAAARYWQALALPLHLVLVGATEDWPERAGPVTLLDPARVPQADLDRIASLANMVADGPLPRLTPSMAPASARRVALPQQQSAPAEPLQFYNGTGGFSPDGSEYRIRMAWDAATGLQGPPLPWTNVIANEQVGVLVSETGAGYTWSRNSREHRLTPWSNDPVRDPHGEALYLRDEDDASWWSPLPGPAPACAGYEAVHGFGYTTFHHASHGLEQECTIFVPRHDPVKIVRIRVRNTGSRGRTLSLFSYQQLVLGGTPADSGRHVATSMDDGVLLATNRMAGPFADGVTFASLIAPAASTVFHSGDRRAFIGIHGSTAMPLALSQARLDGRTGIGLDPCAAFQARLAIAPGEQVECTLVLGETLSRADALALARRYRDPALVDQALSGVRQFWRDTVGAVQVHTPVPAIDIMVNGWLAYQNLSCRIWGRSAFYQSGGAIGYRDQLQDASAMIYTDPGMTRRQICLHAAHQFVEGDVLHWWHPAPIAKGMRTRFSDDLLWLPYVTAFYLKVTGDWSVLDEVEGFLAAPLLDDGEDEIFLRPSPSGTSADVYEHCCRALDRSLTKGTHGLPLMGTGDWNDGMSRVGREGRGESVWMGFFLYRIITDFLPVCERRGDHVRAARYTAYRSHLDGVLNGAGWDGQWYRRAFYDNGAVMGSAESDECQIDALAQAWSVISGAAPADRARLALDAMEARLVSDADGLIRLLAPPFVDTVQDPGYIKGYVAGVRENGGQYTHAACWAVRAVAEAGRGERAAQLLEMLSPISHALSPAAVDTYQVEPYVIAADIYGADPHVGRGGWTWYTGSAGWMYRVAIESVLGFTLQGGDSIRIKPVIPAAWPKFSLRYRVPGGDTSYAINVINDSAGAAPRVASATLDGTSVRIVDGAALLPLTDDGAAHQVTVIMSA